MSRRVALCSAASPRRPQLHLIGRVLRREVALAARRFCLPSAGCPEDCRFPRPSLYSGEFAPLLPGVGFACKGVFITLGRVTNASPLLSRPQGRRISPGEELRKAAASYG